MSGLVDQRVTTSEQTAIDMLKLSPSRVLSRILHSAARFESIALFLSAQEDHGSLIPFVDTTMAVSNPADFRQICSIISKLPDWKFPSPLILIDTLSIAEENELTAIKAHFSTFIVVSGPIDMESELLVQRQLTESLRDRLKSAQAIASSQLVSTYALRRDNEELRTSVFELSEALSRSSKPASVTTFVAPEAEPVILAEPEEIAIFTQVVGRTSRGLAGFDLHLPYPKADDGLQAVVRLRSEDNSDLLGEWHFEPNKSFGWTHFPLQSALPEAHTRMRIEVHVQGLGSRDAKMVRRSRVSVGKNPAGAYADLMKGRERLIGKSLALRFWQTTPGQVLPFWGFKATSRLSQIRPLSFSVPAAVKVSKFVFVTENISAVEKDSSVHIEIPDQGISVIQLAGLYPTRLERAFLTAKLLTANSCCLVRFTTGKPPNAADLVGEIHLRGQHLLPNEPTVLELDIDSPEQSLNPYLVVLPVDVSVPSRILIDIKDASGLWHPDCAQPSVLSPSMRFELVEADRQNLEQRRMTWAATKKTVSTGTLICPIHRLSDLSQLDQTLSRVLGPGCDAVVVAHGDNEFFLKTKESLKHHGQVIFIACGKEYNLGYCMNAGIRVAGGDYVMKIDADDIYFENYAQDMLMWARLSGADVVGKSRIGLLFRDDDELCDFRIEQEEHFVEMLAGGTLCIKRELAMRVPFNVRMPRGTDRMFLIDAMAAGARLFSGDRFNYVHTRRADLTKHTWNGSNEEFRKAHYSLLGTGRDIALFSV